MQNRSEHKTRMHKSPNGFEFNEMAMMGDMSPIKENILRVEIKYFLVFTAMGVLAAFIIYFFSPQHLPYVIEDDHLIENVSAFSFLIAFFLALRVLNKYREWWKFSLFVAIVGLLGFLDEISFGERIFNLDMPVFMGVKIDAVHDFIAIAYLILKNIFGYYGLLFIVLASCMSLILLFIYQKKYSLRDLTGGIHQTLHGHFLILFFFFLITATIIDLKEDYAPLVILEELFEMYAGIALCFYSISLARTKRDFSPEFTPEKRYEYSLDKPEAWR